MYRATTESKKGETGFMAMPIPEFQNDRLVETMAELGWDANRLQLEIAKAFDRIPALWVVKAWLAGKKKPGVYESAIAVVTNRTVDYFRGQRVN